MKYFIACDHGGFYIKDFVKNIFEKYGHEVEDVGIFDENSVDYADIASITCKKILNQDDAMGILICGSGIGMSMAANKFNGIRAALCHNEYSAKMARKHNNANVICLGGRVTANGLLEDILNAWNEATFEGGRHEIRVKKLNELSKKN